MNNGLGKHLRHSSSTSWGGVITYASLLSVEVRSTHWMTASMHVFEEGYPYLPHMEMK